MTVQKMGTPKSFAGTCAGVSRDEYRLFRQAEFIGAGDVEAT